MARTAHTYKLHNVTARRKLKACGDHGARRKPYFVSIENQLTLGYVARWPAAGLWIARRETGRKLSESGKFAYATYEQWKIGPADDLTPANPDTGIFTFEQAKTNAAADAHARPIGGAHARALTVHGAVEQYLASFGEDRERARRLTEGRLTKHVLKSDLAQVKLSALTSAALERWQAGLIRVDKKDPDRERRSKVTANRLVAVFKAALNLAFKNKTVNSDAAWCGLKKFKNVARPRKIHFTMAESLRLINAAKQLGFYEFAEFLEAAIHTGARYEELAACQVKHFDCRSHQLTIPRGKTGSRTTTLSLEGADFFARTARGKTPDAPLLAAPGGGHWPEGAQQDLMKKAVAQAGLPPAATFYAVRHTYISRMRENGAPDWLTAKNCGTSPKMIEDTYGKITDEKKRELIEYYTPKLRAGANTKQSVA